MTARPTGSQAGTPVTDRVAGVGSHGDRLDVLGQDEVQDGEVVRGEVPENIDVGLHKSEVDPDRVNELDFADLPAADELPDPLHRWGVAVGVIAHEHQAGPLRQRRPVSRRQRPMG